MQSEGPHATTTTITTSPQVTSRGLARQTFRENGGTSKQPPRGLAWLAGVRQIRRLPGLRGTQQQQGLHGAQHAPLLLRRVCVGMGVGWLVGVWAWLGGATKGGLEGFDGTYFSCSAFKNSLGYYYSVSYYLFLLASTINLHSFHLSAHQRTPYTCSYTDHFLTHQFTHQLTRSTTPYRTTHLPQSTSSFISVIFISVSIILSTSPPLFTTFLVNITLSISPFTKTLLSHQSIHQRFLSSPLHPPTVPLPPVQPPTLF